VKGEEGLGEAGGEGSLRLGDALLGTSHLGGVAGDEVEHDLLGVELTDGWEDTTGVAGEENDVGGVVGGNTWDLGVLDEFNGVGAGIIISN
jgi:hypothetical protein